MSEAEPDTVYVKSRGQSGSGQVRLHTDRNCPRLKAANKVRPHPRECYPNADVCDWCRGDVDRNHNGSSGVWQQLEEMEPDET